MYVVLYMVYSKPDFKKMTSPLLSHCKRYPETMLNLNLTVQPTVSTVYILAKDIVKDLDPT